MSNSNSSTETENPARSYKYECLDCENYKRKVIEAEQTVSGRDVLIEMLQQEIKKMEQRYKTSIDDYEMLRFKYCTVVQDLSNLREIHKKLEKSNLKLLKERDIAKNQLDILHCEVEKWQDQCKELQNQLMPTEGNIDIKSSAVMHQNILKEVMNIEILMQHQNETVRDVLLKVLKEMKGTKGCKQLEEMLEKPSTVNDHTEGVTPKSTTCSIETKPKQDTAVIIAELNNQIDMLKILVEKLKAENDSIKAQLTEKKSNLAQCLTVLEDNHSNLNNLSGNIEMIINEKEMYLSEITKLKDIIDDNSKQCRQKDQEIYELQCTLNELNQHAEGDLKRHNQSLQKALNQTNKELEQLQEEYLKKERGCNIENCKQLAQTRGPVEVKSKGVNSSLTTLDLDKAINEARNEAEKCENLLRKRIADLEAERDMYKLKLEQNEDSKSKDEVKEENNNNDKLKDYKSEVAVQSEKIKCLEKDLEQAKLENAEYEEENKYYCQKANELLQQLETIEKEKLESENMDPENCKLVAEMREEYEAIISMKDIEIKELKDEINKLKRANVENKTQTVISEMKKSLAIANEEKLVEIKEKEFLKQQVTKLEDEISRMHEADEQQIMVLQGRLNSIESSQNEKQSEIIDQCYCVVKNLKENFANKTCMDENNMSQLRLLENHKIELQKDNEQLKQNIEALKVALAAVEEKYKECDCKTENYETELTNIEMVNEKLENDIKLMTVELCQRDCVNETLQNEIKEMEIEICRRQCTINHLEECLDKSNKILVECEQEMRDMNAENEELKKENEALVNDLHSYKKEVHRTTAEKNELENKFSQVRKENQQFEKEKSELSKNLKQVASLETELTHVRKERQQLEKEKIELSKNLEQQVANLQKELKELKKTYNDLLRTTQEKDDLLKNTRKQIEGLQEALEISRIEFEKVKQAYKDVKDTLSEEIKKYNQETEIMTADNIKVDTTIDENCTICLEVQELQSKIIEKERTIQSLQRQNWDLASEISELKMHVNKLISDNKKLRHAIDNLLATLVQKLKNFTETEDQITLQTNEIIVRDILQSLIDMEKHVMSTNSIPVGKCNCMSIIMSTYNKDGTDSKSRTVPACKLKCGKKIRDLYKPQSGRTSNDVVNMCDRCCGERQSLQDSGTDDHSCCSSNRPSLGPSHPPNTEPYVVEPENTR